MYKSVLDYFEETVQRVPEKMAVRHKEEECTFAGLQEKAQKLGSYIIKLAGSQIGEYYKITETGYGDYKRCL